MSERLKKTLMALARGVVVTLLLMLMWVSRGASFSTYAPWVGTFVIIWIGITAYTWWFYGNSPKAVALQAKVEAKKAEQQLRSGI